MVEEERGEGEVEEWINRVKRRGEGVVRHLHLRRHPPPPPFRVSWAEKAERRFDKRMDRYERRRGGERMEEAYVHACTQCVDEEGVKGEWLEGKGQE